MSSENSGETGEIADKKLTSCEKPSEGKTRKNFDKEEVKNLVEDLRDWLVGHGSESDEDKKVMALRINPDSTLGPWARWLAVLCVVQDECDDDRLSAWLNSTPGVNGSSKGDDLVSIFRNRKKIEVYKGGTGLVFRRLLARLNTVRALRGLPEMSVEELQSAASQKGSLVDCFERFCFWLEEGSQLAPAGIPDALLSAGTAGEQFASVIEKVAEAVCSLPAPSQVQSAEIESAEVGVPRPTLVDRAGAYINLHGRVDGETRRSIVAEIVRRLQKAAERHRPRLGVIYIDASASLMTRSATPSDVLEVMCRQLNIATLGSLQESGEAYDHAIDAVRKSIWRQEVLVVLDGLVHVTGVQAGLVKVMADRDWDAFLRTISQPDSVGLSKRVRREGRWISTVIALSDGPLTESAEWACVQERIGTPEVEIETVLAAPDVLSGDAIAVLMVAASVDGLRQATLQRSLKRWCDAVDVEDSWAAMRPLAAELRDVDVTALCDRLVASSGGVVLDALAKATVPGLQPRQRRYELQLDPLSAEEADTLMRCGRASAAQRLLTFRTEHERRAFLISHFDSGERGDTGRAQRKLAWSSLNWVLGEEALAQATGALRRTSTSVSARARGYRRFLQALHHALHIGSASPSCLNDKSRRPPEHWLMASMPTGHQDRLRYCFASVYSVVVDGDEWLLSRSLGRSDVRVGLLAMFIAEDPRDLIRADAAGDSDAFVRAIRDGWLRSTADCPQPHRELLEEIMLSLATAAVDNENDKIAKCCIDELRELGPRMEHRIAAIRSQWPEATLAALEPGWGRRSSERSRDLIKLELDLMDSADDVDAASDLCKKEIARLAGSALDLDAITRLSDLHAQTLYQSNLNLPSFSGALDAVVNVVLANLTSRQRKWSIVGGLIDLIARLADYSATISDKHAEGDRREDSADYRNSIRGFVESWSLFYIADGLRAALALGRSDGRRWQSISARPYRVYVRVSLKLSRLVADSAVRLARAHDSVKPEEALARAKVQLGVSKALLAHSQERANVYARTLHRYVRERFQSILLQATIVRCWASYAAAEQKINGAMSVTASGAALTILQDALDYVDRAEKVLLELEAPDLLGRRLLLERVSILIGALHSLDEADVKTRAADRLRLSLHAQTYVGALVRVTRNRKFWSRLADRQLARWMAWQSKETKAQEERNGKNKVDMSRHKTRGDSATSSSLFDTSRLCGQY